MLRFFYALFVVVLLSGCYPMPFREQQVSIAQINVQLGMSDIEREQLVAAKQKLSLALQQAPTLPEAWYSMGYYLEITGQTAEAERYYLKAVALAPDRPDVQKNYGNYLCRHQRYREGLQHLHVAIKYSNLDRAALDKDAALCGMHQVS